MKGKKTKPVKGVTNTVGSSAGVVPTGISVTPREPLPALQIDPTPLASLPQNPYQEIEIFKEWPGEDAALAHDFALGTDKLFKQTTVIKEPPSMRDGHHRLIAFKRIRDLIKNQGKPSAVYVNKSKLRRCMTMYPN
jgi:hypothetical protein